MSDTQYIGWWSLGYVEDHQEDLLDRLDGERFDNGDDGLFIKFDEEDAYEAAQGGLAICEVDGDVDPSEMDRNDLGEQLPRQ